MTKSFCGLSGKKLTNRYPELKVRSLANFVNLLLHGEPIHYGHTGRITKSMSLWPIFSTPGR